jgi:hypothetical protein
MIAATRRTGLAAAQGQEGLDLGGVVKRMGLEVEQFQLGLTQRRNPIRIASIQLPRELEELFLLLSRGDRLDHEIRHRGILPY